MNGLYAGVWWYWSSINPDSYFLALYNSKSSLPVDSNNGLPLPSATGTIRKWYSSIRLALIKGCASEMLPHNTISFPSYVFSSVTAFTASVLMISASGYLPQEALVNDLEKTIFGMLFSLSAITYSSLVAVGQNSANNL